MFARKEPPGAYPNKGNSKQTTLDRHAIISYTSRVGIGYGQGISHTKPPHHSLPGIHKEVCTVAVSLPACGDINAVRDLLRDHGIVVCIQTIRNRVDAGKLTHPIHLSRFKVVWKPEDVHNAVSRLLEGGVE